MKSQPYPVAVAAIDLGEWIVELIWIGLAEALYPIVRMQQSSVPFGVTLIAVLATLALVIHLSLGWMAYRDYRALKRKWSIREPDWPDNAPTIRL